MLDTHFRLLRQDFVEPLREAVLGYRKEQLRAQQDVGAVHVQPNAALGLSIQVQGSGTNRGSFDGSAQ